MRCCERVSSKHVRGEKKKGSDPPAGRPGNIEASKNFP